MYYWYDLLLTYLWGVLAMAIFSAWLVKPGPKQLPRTEILWTILIIWVWPAWVIGLFYSSWKLRRKKYD